MNREQWRAFWRLVRIIKKHQNWRTDQGGYDALIDLGFPCDLCYLTLVNPHTGDWLEGGIQQYEPVLRFRQQCRTFDWKRWANMTDKEVKKLLKQRRDKA